MHEPDQMRRALFRAWLVWCAFVVYGSLLPFEFRSISWAQAVQTFAQLSWLDLGLGSRLDWLANVLLYAPLGFLGTATAVAGGTAGKARPRGWPSLLPAAMAHLMFGMGLAVAIEFAQVFFAPRTISLNDLAAESFGTAIGCVAALAFGRRLIGLLAAANRPEIPSRGPLLKLYVLAYAALTLFPFDFSTAAEVLAQKLSNGHAGWWIAQVNFANPLRGVLKLTSEIVLTLPFGWLLARRAAPMRWPAAALVGLGLGALIEFAQLFLLSATSQGVSVLTRAAGFAIGAALAPSAASLARALTPGATRLTVAAITVPWLLVLAYLAGWGRSPVAPGDALARAAEVHYLPFYYHYFAGEARALTSLLQFGALYAWVGIAGGLVWTRPRAGLAATLAAATAAVFEASQLMLADRHPDPTNVLIAAASAWLAHSVLQRLRGREVAATSPVASGGGGSNTAPLVPREPDSTLALGAWPGMAAAVFVGSTQAFPGNGIATVVAVAAYTVCVWLQPRAALFLIPVAVALTDVASYTGQQWLGALDWMMLATLALAFLHPAARGPGARVSRRAPPLALWLLLGLMPGALIGMQGLDIASPDTLLTPLGSGWGAMQAKGVLWAGTFALFMWRLRIDAHRAASAFGHGMLVALSGVALLTIWERLSFVGPFDFTSDYRAPGPFSAIALGGAFIEAFLVATTPFAVAAAMTAEARWLRWGSAMLVLAAAYATMVTYSRAGQVVFLLAVAGTVAMLALGRLAGVSGAVRLASHAKAALLVLAVATVSASILLAPYATTRFANLGPDARGRLAHWTEGLGFSQGGVTASLFGNGAGTFGREAYVLGEPKTRPGMFALHRDAGNTWLRVRPGSLSYFDQRVAVDHEESFTVSARLRASEDRGVQVLLCEKDLVQSRTCGVAKLRTPADGQWHVVSGPLTLPSNPMAGWPARPTRLTLFAGGGEGTVDVDDLSLIDANGRERLRNGDFEDESAHWMYSSDQHLTWHMKSLWLHVYFEYGLLGVLAHAGLLLAGLLGAWRSATAGQPTLLAVGVALLALQGVGLIDSVIDAPRFLQLYLSLALLGSLAGRALPVAGSPARR